MPLTEPTAILHEVCSLPTAPFVEDRVVDYVRQFAAQRPGVKLSVMAGGNLVLELRGGRGPRWVFTAHMDHPGMVARRMVGGNQLEADFRGHVLASFLKGERVRFHDGEGEVAGAVTGVETGKDKQYPVRVRVRVGRPVAQGAIGMFDQGVGRVRKGEFYCRACDDVAGVAAALAMLDTLASKPPKVSVAVLLTRAEEVGFVGATAACLDGRVLRRTDRVIVLETPAEQPYAPRGGGPIVRVGDRRGVFNAALTHFITHQAQALSRKDASFKFQRALMPGGTCEATVFDAYGYMAGSICVPLGNYHNMDQKRHRLGPEIINVGDWLGLVKLLVHVTRQADQFDPSKSDLRKWIEGIYRPWRKLL